MTRFRFSVCLTAMIAAAGFGELAVAGGSSGGSSGGYASSGGSSGGAVAYSSASSGGSYGSSGGYASSGGSSGGRVGPFRRMAERIRAKRAARRAAASSGGSYGSSGGSYGSSGGSSGGQAVSYGSSGGSSGGSAGSVSYSTSARYSVPLTSYARSTSTSRRVAPRTAIAGYESSSIESSYRQSASSGRSIVASNAEATAPAAESEDRYEAAKPALDDDAALLVVTVPDDAAKVTVNGRETTSAGAVRKFMSRGLKEGFLYTYVVKVTYDVDGETKTESREVKLRPGDNEQVVFEAPEGEAKPEAEDMSSNASTPAKRLVTVVKLHVPTDAQVNLAGNDTNGQGDVRTFRTTQLKPGDSWKNYTVRVTSKVDGKLVSRERTIDVAAGSTNELRFDFDAPVVATR